MPVLESRTKMSVEEFLSLPQTHDRMELVDGEVIMSPRPRTDHQKFIGHMYHVLRLRVGMTGSLILEKEVIVRASDGEEQVRVPDLCYVREDRQYIITQEAVRGAPDLLVEVLSESTEEVDRIIKRDEYAATGVPEYWIVDIDSRSVHIHYFASGKEGHFEGEEPFENEVLRDAGLPCEFSVPEVFEILR